MTVTNQYCIHEWWFNTVLKIQNASIVSIKYSWDTRKFIERYFTKRIVLSLKVLIFDYKKIMRKKMKCKCVHLLVSLCHLSALANLSIQIQKHSHWPQIWKHIKHKQYSILYNTTHNLIKFKQLWSIKILKNVESAGAKCLAPGNLVTLSPPRRRGTDNSKTLAHRSGAGSVKLVFVDFPIQFSGGVIFSQPKLDNK